jgi:hypothetical protein
VDMRRGMDSLGDSYAPGDGQFLQNRPLTGQHRSSTQL